MMDYKVALQLRDAGYPQAIRAGKMVGRMKIPDMNAYEPTLDEMIETIIEECGGLIKIEKWPTGKRSVCACLADHHEIQFGETFSEAAALVYLRIKEKARR